MKGAHCQRDAAGFCYLALCATGGKCPSSPAAYAAAHEKLCDQLIKGRDGAVHGS